MKIKEFQNYLKTEDIDYTLFFSNPTDRIDFNFLYFSGFDSGILLITQNDIVLITSQMEYPRAKKEAKIKKIIARYNPFEYINKIKAKKVGLNYERVSLNSKSRIKKYLKLKNFVDISKKCDELRLTKTPKEINYTKKACKITDGIFEEIINNFNFKTELEVANKIHSLMGGDGLLNLSFNPIVANAKNSGIAHSSLTKNKLKKGFLVMDFGVIYENYCSDLTRTFYIGKPSKKEIEDYNLVLDAQLKAISLIKINKPVSELDKVVKDMLGKRFIHSLGHGIGLRIHEAPSIYHLSKEIFKENMIFTIEPGIYNRNYGIRIEDDILLKKNKIEILTKSSKELITL
ncbi:MAG: Xaa-Pro peptidase family protein [Candidatus Nanoarchaeia archaeon]|jgi:Xaa-Pro dipeptidase|nr:Xaa-Pro peptidase family protein [Candidatus Nanoarchaeia archaeon]|tara:strand:+ start:290 stop:1324 length:1035 start_codon:yes stop_codon:yes gene_type:complete